MRPILIAFSCLVAAGCGGQYTPGGEGVAGEGAVESSLTGAPLLGPGGFLSADGTQTCFQNCTAAGFPAGSPPAGDNPWGTSKGYLLSHTALNVRDNTPADFVFGLDLTRTTILWTRRTNNVAYYENLAGTIPYSCPTALRGIEAGQIGSGNTNTGTGNQVCDTFCFPNSQLLELQTQCACQASSAEITCEVDGRSCGSTVDYCKNTISCGSCGAAAVCSASGECSCRVKICPKGTYSDGNCGCQSGLPQ